MTLTIHAEEDEQRQLAVQVEVDEGRVRNEMRKVARKLARSTQVPGFRRGKAPYNIIVRRFGEDAIRAEAVDEMMESVFTETMAELEPELYAPADIEDIQLQPLVVKFTMPLAPRVELGDYRAIRLEVPPVSIEEEAVEEQLKAIQMRHQVLEPVERPAQLGDVVTVKGQGKARMNRPNGEEGVESSAAQEEAGSEPAVETVFNEERIDFLLDGNELYFGPPFVERLVGVEVGADLSFAVTYGDDEEQADLAGRTVTFDLNILEVKQRDLPPIDDDLAQEEGDYETLAALRASLADDLEKRATAQAREDLLDKFIDEILGISTLKYPPAAIERELDSMLENYKQQVTMSGWQWEDFLRLEARSEDDLKADWEEKAATRLKRGLILHELIHAEAIEVDDDEIVAAVGERLADFENEETRKVMADWMAEGQGRDMIGNDLMMDKIYDRVAAIVTGNAPELGASTSRADEEE